jgi:hypothetical protein
LIKKPTYGIVEGERSGPVTKTTKVTNRKGEEFSTGDVVRFSPGDYRGARTLVFTVTSFMVQVHTSFGKPCGQTTWVYGVCSDGVAFGGCSLGEITMVRRKAVTS